MHNMHLKEFDIENRKKIFEKIKNFFSKKIDFEFEEKIK